MLDLLTFAGLAALIFFVAIHLWCWGMRWFILRRARGPFRRYARKVGREQARALVRRLQETGERPPELEPVCAEIERMG